MTATYPNWTSSLGSGLIRRAVESYLDEVPEARNLTPEVVLAQAGLVIVGAPSITRPESFIAQVASADHHAKLINAEKVLREITRLSEHSSPAAS